MAALAAPKILPPFWFLIAMALMYGLSVVDPFQPLFGDWSRAVAALLVVLGFGVVVWGARCFQRAGTPIKPFEPSLKLVTDGPFRISRNPMYVGMLLMLLGAGFAFNALSPWVIIPTFVWLIEMQFIRREEVLMEDTFGEEYLQYKARVRRWLW